MVLFEELQEFVGMSPLGLVIILNDKGFPVSEDWPSGKNGWE